MPVPPPAAQEAMWREEATMAMRQATELAHGAVVQAMEPNRKTGTSMRSVATEVIADGTSVVGVVGTNYPPVLYQAAGTGLWGPSHAVIRPKQAQALRFPQPGNGGFTLAGRQRSGQAGAGASWVFAKYVRGVRPKRYFELATHMVAADVVAVFRAAGVRLVTRLGGA